MAFTTSSMLGVDLNNASTTQLFALNQKVFGSDNSEWQYVLATAALTTGQGVVILGGGTAVLTEDTSSLSAAGPGGDLTITGNLDIGFAQFTVAAGSYAFVLKNGSNAYVAVSGTCIPGTGIAFARTGKLVPMADGTVGATAAGIFIKNTAGSTATAAVATALVKFPRKLATAAIGTM